jgi:predicted ATPase
MSDAINHPSGTVTFLFTDVEGSTRLWAADAEAMSASLLVHDAVVRSAIESAGGYVFTTAGDSFAAAFSRASDAVSAAAAIQAGLDDAVWLGPALRVRIGMHLGEAEERGGDYFGPTVNMAARVEAAGHGGQTLLTDSVRSAARLTARDLGVHELRDVDEPVRLFQLGDGEFAPLRVADNTPSSNLPVRPTRLIGRSEELDRVRRLLAEHRLVTISAVGGSGKTRLAVAVGEAELLHRPAGVWLVDLTEVMHAGELPGAIAGSLGLHLVDGDATSQVINFLADKAALVILDNCEHVIDACADFVEAFLAVGGGTVLLATSREALDVDGEQVMHLASLSSSSTDGAHSPAVQLFAERAAAIEPGFSVTSENVATVVELCERLDGMPLAIELAAARITVLSPVELVQGLSDRFSVLSGGRRRQRQRTLEATVAWSYDLLEPEQQRVFRAVGVFVGGFDLDAVAATVGLPRGLVIDVVEALVAKSLVVRISSDSVSRFTLLETLKAYTEDRLVESGEAAAVRNLHAAYFHDVVMAGHGRAISADARVGECLRFDRANITAGFDWLMDNDQLVRAGELLLGSQAVYLNYGHAGEAVALFHRCEQLIEDVDLDLVGQLRASIIPALVVIDDFPTMFARAEQLRSSTDPALRGFGCGYLAFGFSLIEQETARGYLVEAAEQLALAQVDRPGLNTDIASGMYRGVEGVLLGYAGDYVQALASIDEMPDTLARHDHLSTSPTGLLPQAAAYHILLGQPAAGLERLTPLSDVGYAYGALHEIVALAHFASNDIDAARHDVRVHATEAATGRLSRQCNDAVMLLAELALAEGEPEAAVRLIADMGFGRSPGTIAYANDLAQRLGIADEFATRQQTLRDPGRLAEHGVLGSLTAMRALRAELARRGWD